MTSGSRSVEGGRVGEGVTVGAGTAVVVVGAMPESEGRGLGSGRNIGAIAMSATGSATMEARAPQNATLFHSVRRRYLSRSLMVDCTKTFPSCRRAEPTGSTGSCATVYPDLGTGHFAFSSPSPC